VCRMGLAISFASTVKEKVCIVFLCILLHLPLCSVFSLESNFISYDAVFCVRDLRLDLKMICNDFLVVKVNCWSNVFNIIQSI